MGQPRQVAHINRDLNPIATDSTTLLGFTESQLYT
jgi:hypothetical protein